MVSSAGETPARSTTRETPALTTKRRAAEPDEEEPEPGRRCDTGVILPEPGRRPAPDGWQDRVVSFLIRVVVNALALGVAAWLFDGITRATASETSERS